MPVVIRLMRIGKKGQPSYRIVAVDERKKRTGSYLEKIGFYDPVKKKDQLTLDNDKLEAWKSKGALISDGASKLFKSKLFKDAVKSK